MESIHWFVILFAFIVVLFADQSKAQSPSASTSPAGSLDTLLQDYAFRAFVHPHTAVVYDAAAPSNLTGIKLSVVRYRYGSLRKRGVLSYKEFQIPVGVIILPYVQRLAIVYQNLGNWSSTYYPLPGFTYLAPVIGLLAYDATNLSATNLPELGFLASQSPILIKFADVTPVPSGLTALCVWFNLDGSPQFRDLVSTNVCSTYRQGHFSIVVNTTELAPSPAPSPGPGFLPSGSKSNKSKVWKIVVAVIGGFGGLVLLALLVAWIHRCRQNRKVTEMERRADVGESLRMARVGDTQAPVAFGTRTQPMLENEYVA